MSLDQDLILVWQHFTSILPSNAVVFEPQDFNLITVQRVSMRLTEVRSIAVHHNIIGEGQFLSRCPDYSTQAQTLGGRCATIVPEACDMEALLPSMVEVGWRSNTVINPNLYNSAESQMEHWIQTNPTIPTRTTARRGHQAPKQPPFHHVELSVLNNKTCPICLSPVKDPVCTLCGHIFCFGCIQYWLYQPVVVGTGYNKNCPSCRTMLL